MSRRQINVRLSEEEYAAIEKLAKEHNRSKSEIVRTAFQGELAKLDASRNKTLSADERSEMLVKLGSMLTGLSEMRNHTNGMGRNINQMAKLINSGQIPRVSGFDEAVKYSENVKQNLEVVAEELNRIWHTLV